MEIDFYLSIMYILYVFHWLKLFEKLVERPSSWRRIRKWLGSVWESNAKVPLNVPLLILKKTL